MLIKLLAFLLPLGLDSFAIAASLAASRPLDRRDRLRVAAVFTAFEAGMPLVGVALGHGLARALGSVADYLAAAALIAIGAWMLLGENEQAEEDRAQRLTTAHGLSILALGLSISVDELAIGFSLGLTRMWPAAVIIAIAVQAFVAAQLGMALGKRLNERHRERAEQLAAIALIVLGIVLGAEKIIA